jgi:hypothetical protein
MALAVSALAFPTGARPDNQQTAGSDRLKVPNDLQAHLQRELGTH